MSNVKMFSNISFKEGIDDADPNFQANNSNNEWLNYNFTAEEIKSEIQKLKLGKACGLDLIRNEMLRNAPSDLIDIIVRLFNVILNTGLVPENWCLGAMMPLYKGKGSRSDPDNFRGITLLSCLSKLFTSILNRRLTFFLDGTGSIGEEQAGFRRGYSTTDHIFALHAIIQFYQSKGKQVYAAFVDYRKAFDFVDRASLWSKMLSLGINGNILKVICNIYSKAKSCIKSSKGASDFFRCNIGVRQGENLSPLLFAIFLNDFEFFLSRDTNYNGLGNLAEEFCQRLSTEDTEVFFRLFCLLYADDTIILAESAFELQCALNKLNEYCQLWHLNVNASKTKIVIFSAGVVQNYP